MSDALIDCQAVPDVQQYDLQLSVRAPVLCSEGQLAGLEDLGSVLIGVHTL